MALTKINNNTLSSAGIATGKVLQVVQGTHATEASYTSTSFVVTNTDLNITPSASSSKILVQVSLPFHVASANNEFAYTIYRDSTNLGSSSQGFGTLRSNATLLSGTVTWSFLDTPSSTSQIHYEAYIKRNAGSGLCALNYNGGTTSTITAFEMGA